MTINPTRRKDLGIKIPGQSSGKFAAAAHDEAAPLSVVQAAPTWAAGAEHKIPKLTDWQTRLFEYFESSPSAATIRLQAVTRFGAQATLDDGSGQVYDAQFDGHGQLAGLYSPVERRQLDATDPIYQDLASVCLAANIDQLITIPRPPSVDRSNALWPKTVGDRARADLNDVVAIAKEFRRDLAAAKASGAIPVDLKYTVTSNRAGSSAVYVTISEVKDRFIDGEPNPRYEHIAATVESLLEAYNDSTHDEIEHRTNTTKFYGQVRLRS